MDKSDIFCKIFEFLEMISTPPEQLRSSSSLTVVAVAASGSGLPALLETALPEMTDFLHLVDWFQLSKVNTRLAALANKLMKLNDNFQTLYVHGLESTAQFEDLMLSDYIVCGPQGAVGRLLFGETDRFSDAESLVIYNFEEIGNSINFKFLSKMPRISTIKLFNVDSFDIRIDNGFKITTLKIGFNQPLEPDEDQIGQLSNLPNLRTLDITGFPISQASVEWLLKLLSGAKGLKWFRINCESRQRKSDSSNVLRLNEDNKWNNAALFFLEIVTESFRNSRIVEFADILFKTASAVAFAELHTVTLNCGATETVLRSLAVSPNVIHAVLTNCCPVINLKIFSEFLKLNCLNLQILVLKFNGIAKDHLDSITQLIMNSGNSVKHKPGIPIPPLERLEIEVVMDPHTGLMETPYHTIRGLSILRCRYRDNMFFNRHKFGFAMACQRFLCTDSDLGVSPASPMELFCEEMIKGMYDAEEQNSTKLENDMIYEWNAMGQIQRAAYVEIFDEFVERELRFDDELESERPPDCSAEKLCDVAATMANLRE